MKFTVIVCGLSLLLTSAMAEQLRLRRPVAQVLSDDGDRLFVANRVSGTLSIIDTGELKVLGEVDLLGRPSDITSVPGRVLVVDDETHTLEVLSQADPDRRQRLGMPEFPVSVVGAGDRCFVASLWPRRVTMVHLDSGEKPEVEWSIAVPFAPREQLLVQDGKKLLVADAFGGRLAVVDVDGGKVESVKVLPGHNIRGLALDAGRQRILVSHQALNRLARTSFDDVHWGTLMGNVVRVLRVESVLNASADVRDGEEVFSVGDVGNAGADPAGVVAYQGGFVVTLSGVGKVSWGGGDAGELRTVSVGKGGGQVLKSHDPKSRKPIRAFVANEFADSISVIDLAAGEVLAEVKLGEMRELTAAERGEVLFRDGKLSHDGWLSCHSCHTDGHSNGQLADTLGDGSYGAPKRVLSLLGVGDSGPWAWNGSMKRLEDQVRKSVVETMHGEALTDGEASDLTAFLRMLKPPPAGGRISSEAVERGKRVFEDQRCVRCHEASAYTSDEIYDVDLHDEMGNLKFNPPSLRALGHRAGGFFHDGRARTLEEVFGRFKHQLSEDLSEDEVRDLIRFLRSL